MMFCALYWKVRCKTVDLKKNQKIFKLAFDKSKIDDILSNVSPLNAARQCETG